MAISMSLETITPEVAKRYLLANTRNRKLGRNRVLFYASMMRDGHWKLTHQGIGFDDVGSLIDGQHRLEAVVLSGCTVQMWVARGLAEESKPHIDDGKPRSDADIITMSGYEITKNEVAVAKAMWSSYVEQQWGYAWSSTPSLCSRETMMKFIDFHAEAMDFSKPVRGTKGLTNAIIRAVIACAWWTVDTERLACFRDQLQSGVVDDVATDGAVIKLRDWLLMTRLSSGGQLERKEVFGRCASALMAYLERRPLAKLYLRKDAIFPLPVCDEFKCIGKKADREQSRPA